MNNILSTIPLLLLFAGVLSASEGQFELIHADRSLGKVVDGKKIRILTGDVVARQDTLNMNCEQAVFYEDENRIDFIGKVRIEDGHHVLWARKIRYYTDTRKADCIGNVRISGKTDSLYAEKFIYRFRDRIAEGQNNVFVWDKLNRTRLWGDYGIHNSLRKYTLIKKNARFEHQETDQSDTMIINSGKMEYFGREPRLAVAVRDVKIRQGELKANCDSAVYRMSEDLIHLRVNPIAWEGESEMQGALIDLKMDSLKVKDIFIQDEAHLKSLGDSARIKYNYLRGKSIEVELENRKPVRITARHNASSIYILNEQGRNQGTNSASSDSIIIYFTKGEMDSIAIIGGTEGIMYPANYQGEIKGEY
jgi:lipopolysaccharide export system protein LptA